ncbi:MAG: flavin reductase family protein [bacterium]|nr:flavin reductase family protein [bacterium]
MQVQATYSEASARKFPEQAAIIVAKDEEGKHNPFTVGWIMPVSMDPPMWAFCAARERYTLEAIRLSKSFVISFPSSEMAEAASFFGSHSGRDMDKLKEFGAEVEPATKIDSVLFRDAVANFECVLDSEYTTGDCVTVVGKVVASHMNSDASVRRLYVLGEDLSLGGVVVG